VHSCQHPDGVQQKRHLHVAVHQGRCDFNRECFVQIRVFRSLILVSFLAVACSSQGSDPASTQDVYRPPTPIPTDALSSPFLEGESQSSQGDQRPTPTPACINGLWFFSDVTIPDGTVVGPGERLDKRWEVQNGGTCNWDEHYGVKLIAGPGMGVPVQQALIPALSGTQVIIRMVLIAPQEPGNYRSAWQAFDPQDNPFGDPFFIDIVVAEPESEPGGE
jgi:hypothetical protein